MQQNNGDAPVFRDISQASSGNRQLDGAVGAVTGLEAVYIFTQVATTFSTDQGDGKQIAAALHNALAQKRAASARMPALYR
jgi:hypothetical protein